MKEKQKLHYMFLAIFVLVISNCSIFTKKHADPFYNIGGIFDSPRLPLINPYYLIYIEEQYGWQLPKKGNLPDNQFHYNLGDLLNVEKVDVRNGMVMAYTPRSFDQSNGQKVLHWFIFIPNNKNFELGFESEDEMINYLEEIGVDQPEWIKPSLAYQEYSKIGCIYWIPDCQ